MYAINAPTVPEPLGSYSQGSTAGRFVFTSGQVGVDPKNGTRLVAGGVGVEMLRILDITTALLSECGCTLSDVAQCTIFVTNLDDVPVIDDICAHFFPLPAPARSVVEVSRLPLGAHVEMACMACR